MRFSIPMRSYVASDWSFLISTITSSEEIEELYLPSSLYKKHKFYFASHNDDNINTIIRVHKHFMLNK